MGREAETVMLVSSKLFDESALASSVGVSSNMVVVGMKGDVEGIAMLMEGGPSTGRKLLLFPRFAEKPPVLPNIEAAEGRLEMGAPSGKVVGEVKTPWPNSDVSPSKTRRVGNVIAERVMLILGRAASGGPMSDAEWSKGGGSDMRLAEAEAAKVALSCLSPLSRFIDIFRKKPHLPPLFDVLVESESLRTAGGERSES
jgi:hypothetical protein